MTPLFFEHILHELKPYTQEIAYHMGGDPLTLSNLKAYLDLTHQNGFKGLVTTSGYYLSKHPLSTLLHPAVKQLNISLNSFNKNDLTLSFEAYMQPIIDLCHAKQRDRKELFINLRIWNIDEMRSEEKFNAMLFEYLSLAFDTPLDLHAVYTQKPRSIRLAERVLLHFETYFEWPSLASSLQSEGTCLGMKSHFGILSNGEVVPCCLDKDGVIALGNLHDTSLHSIITSPRVQTIQEGFRHGHAVEPLCQKCRYKERFKEIV